MSGPTQKSEKRRNRELAEYLEVYERPSEGEYGPGSGQFVSAITATEICIDTIRNHIKMSYSVLNDPELYPLMSDALEALLALDEKLKLKEKTHFKP